MTTHLHAVAILSRNGAAVHVSTLDRPLDDDDIAMTSWALGPRDVLINVWWPNGTPDTERQGEVYLAVLKDLHDLLLEKAGVDASPTSLIAALATTIIDVVGASSEDRDGQHDYQGGLG